MKRLLFFVCTVFALAFTDQLTTSVKLSLRQGPQKPETANPDKFAMSGLKNCTMCPRLFKPICASNGNWYHNPCFMACEVGDNSSINILYEGICRTEHSSTKHSNITRPSTDDDRAMTSCGRCEEHDQPVCGTNGKTYVNKCLMDCRVNSDIVKVAYEGKCLRNTPEFSSTQHYTLNTPEFSNCTVCPKIYDPVCMTNGEWYYNTCVMHCALGNDTDHEIRYRGKCINFWRKSEDTTKRS